MTIRLPKDLESCPEAAVESGRFASLDDAMAEAARLLLGESERTQRETTTSSDDMKILYERIRDFDLDEPDADLTFAARLAKANGWSQDLAIRIIDEYKRFAFLAMAAGHPVCPSNQVDEAWHLHLTYTRSYWHRFCALLGKPLHHQPTKGGPAELEKLIRWYQQTLASYRRLFGSEPPRDIWPAAHDRFFVGQGHRRVDLNTHWVIPKPRLRRAAAMVMAAGAAGPAAGMTLNPFDFNGPTFILLYLVLLPLAVVSARPTWLLRPPPRTRPDTCRATWPVCRSSAILTVTPTWAPTKMVCWSSTWRAWIPAAFLPDNGTSS
jgi:Arc/MetJ-type ribon-helix-helix transcriptional regulator